MTAMKATVYVCTSCRRRIGEGEVPEAFDRPGTGLAADLTANLADDPAIKKALNPDAFDFEE